MNCFIYKSLKKDELYLYLDRKDDFSAIPAELYKSFGRLEFVMELELTPQRKLARVDSAKVIASLQAKGFFVQMPPTVFSAVLPTAARYLH
ncbi:YcgL domain-containing protein [Methylomonas sp. SURF-1]|uniref:YcgL domain-containing protein NP603_01520 n=1 Tax=Methylomonas aurea TaxID=2952224 RepID=A0ABT1UC22_9GAMM|nr:YcgL domain-containing protein [Methylomonas sp. SURF-1]MCQ8179775.1 YcgL domain-containing protein [Methylomonas sp. SURF-1]